jgi:hypothetical protein
MVMMSQHFNHVLQRWALIVVALMAFMESALKVLSKISKNQSVQKLMGDVGQRQLLL